MMKEDKQHDDLNSVVTASEIRNILNDFRIGKKPLAKLLGWGETTIIRYIEGDIPTAEYSNKLREIANEPAYYYELLQRNKDNLTNVAYRKSKQAVLEKMMESKISLIAQYVIYLIDGDVSAFYVQVVLYYAQGFSFALYDKELFDEDYGINQKNIPYLRLYESMKKHGVNVLEVPHGRLSDDEIKLIKAVVEAFSWYGPKALRATMASERINYRISRDKNNNRIISKELLKKSFKDIVEQYDIHNINDIHKYPDKKVNELRNK